MRKLDRQFLTAIAFDTKTAQERTFYIDMLPYLPDHKKHAYIEELRSIQRKQNKLTNYFLTKLYGNSDFRY
jgi:uncharacterized circularly permuted ATP-grasp superfamily protein